jgi:hypothetical protein
MTELEDDFRAFWEYKKKRKEQAYLRAKPEQRLAEAGIGFTTHNDGLHLVVDHNEKIVDFWPTTGRWIARKGRKGWGVKGLIEYLDGEKSRRGERKVVPPIREPRSNEIT